jgi:DNA polymerase (family X)
MDNFTIADQLTLLSKLMDIHGENSFKSKSYSIAAFNIEKLPFQLKDTSPEEIFRIKSIGEAIGKKILEIIQTNHFPLLEKYMSSTPPGVIEMLQIKGLGPKKIATVWKELGIETIGELLYACDENRLLLYKGFGAKTQEMIRQNITFYLSSREKFLFAEVETTGLLIEKKLKELLPHYQTQLTGKFRRNDNIIDEIELLTSADKTKLLAVIPDISMTLVEENENSLLLSYNNQVKIKIYFTSLPEFISQLFITTGSEAFLNKFLSRFSISSKQTLQKEEDIFSQNGLAYLPPYLREGLDELAWAEKKKVPEMLTRQDIKGIIHSHSNWSDGANTLEEMATGCKNQGFEYLVISDHSQSAFYANGLSHERIKQQHAQIEELNVKLAPFKIFKSIEADILNDGNLDYTNDILSTFDLVIASVHSNLKMTEEKAMMRLLKAIENPYTTILGHMTGRLLLSREGYPVNHQQVIEACLHNHVVIEINAHPRRLDIDWQWVPYALSKGILLSVDPDAHSIEGFKDVYYGVVAGRKGGLTKATNLSSFSLTEFENFLSESRKWKKL